LLIGYDTRFASEDFARAAAEVVTANGIRVLLCNKPTPTPVISYGVPARETAGAIVITASHNPARWNGFKYKSQDGASASTEVIDQLEKNVAVTIATGKIERQSILEAEKQGLVDYIALAPLYQAQIESLLDLEALRKAHLNIAIDSMYGAGAGYFKALLENSNNQVIEINAECNPAFPGMKQPEPIAVNLDKLVTLVKKEKTSVGLATDGDSDRIGIIDEKGNFLNQLQVFALLALYLLEVRGQRGAIIKTITTTSMLYRLGEIFNVPIYETAVGFKYVAPLMLDKDAMVGGEESGGYGFRGHVPERDALLAGLFFLDLMTRTGKTPSELLEYLYSKVGPHYYDRLDIEFPERQRGAIINRLKDSDSDTVNGVAVVKKDTFDGFRFTLADNSWLLIRFSGTEPLLRIYAESDSHAGVSRLLQTGQKMVEVPR
jgi:alpha-D-glucose phosphate-specific phosphoglucomutase